MKNRFFESICYEDNYFEWCKFIDWLFNDDKFQSWDKNTVCAYTKEIKRLPDFDNKNYLIMSGSGIGYQKTSNKKFIVQMQRGDSESKDLIRHIRNGIAHGNASIKRSKNNEKVLTIVDYGKRTKEGVETGQTAFIQLTIQFLFELFNSYKKRNCSSSKR